MKTWAAAVLLLLTPPVAWAEDADPCKTSTWFRDTKVSVRCPIGNPQQINILIPWNPAYRAAPAGQTHLEEFNAKRGEIALEIEYLATDLETKRLTLGTGHVADVFLNPVQLQIDVPFKELGDLKAIQSLRLVFPPEIFFCSDETLITKETTFDLQLTDLAGNPQPIDKCIKPDDSEVSRPLDWQINAAPADDDAQDDAGLAVDFDFNKVWGYGLHIDPQSQSWSSNLWRVEVAGTGTTNDANFYDSVTADLSWSRNRAFLGEGIKGRPITAYWWGAYFRPETTFQDDTRDYVFGARVEVLANLKTLIGTDVGRGIRPYLALGVERVDPDKREDGTIPENYERATGDFLWKFSPFRFNRIRVEASWEAKYILDEDDLAALGLDDRLQDKLELSVGLDVTGRREFLPFLKYTRGSEAPRFDVVEEVLFGLLWNRIAPGELPQ